MAKQNASILQLVRRPCRLGESINSRTEHHGSDNDVPACDVPITGIMLDTTELETLLGKGAYKALYVNAGGVAEPSELAKRCKTFSMADKFIESHAILSLGIDEYEVELVDVTVSRIKLEPQVGGLTAASLQLQSCAAAEAVARIYAHMGNEITAEIRIGKKDEGKNDKQKELGLKSKGGEPPAE